MKEKFIKICDNIIFIGLIIYVISVSISISGQGFGISLALLFWIIRMFLSSKNEFKNVPFRHYIELYILTLILATLFSINFIKSLDRIRVIIGQIVLFYLIINGIKTIKQFKTLIYLFIFIPIISSLYGISQYIKFSSSIRITGLLHHPNSFGGCLGIIIPIFFSLVLFSRFIFRSKFLRIFNNFALFIILYSLILTFCRGAWIGVFFAILFMAFIYKKRVFVGVLIAIIILSPLALYEKKIKERLIHTFIFQQMKKESSNMGRIYIWKSALLIIRDYPILGTGPNTFNILLYTIYRQPKLEKFGPTYLKQWHAHNIFLNTAAENGIINMVLLILLIILGFKCGLELYKKSIDNWEKMLILGTLGSLIDFTIHGLVDCTHLGTTGYLFWFILGIIGFIKKNKEKKLNNGVTIDF